MLSEKSEAESEKDSISSSSEESSSDDNSKSFSANPVLKGGLPESREAAKLRRIEEIFQKKAAFEERQRKRRENRERKKNLQAMVAAQIELKPIEQTAAELRQAEVMLGLPSS